MKQMTGWFTEVKGRKGGCEFRGNLSDTGAALILFQEVHNLLHHRDSYQIGLLFCTLYVAADCKTITHRSVTTLNSLKNFRGR